MKKSIIIHLIWILVNGLLIGTSFLTISLVTKQLSDGSIAGAVAIIFISIPLVISVAASFINMFLTLILLLVKETSTKKVFAIIVLVLKTITLVPSLLMALGLLLDFSPRSILESLIIFVNYGLCVFFDYYLIKNYDMTLFNKR